MNLQQASNARTRRTFQEALSMIPGLRRPETDRPAPSTSPRMRRSPALPRIAASGAGIAPVVLHDPTAGGSSGTAKHTLVVLFMRGGCDGLSAVAPRGLTPGSGADAFYEAERLTPTTSGPPGPQLAIPIPAAGNEVVGLTDSNGTYIPWMLSAGAKDAHQMYEDKNLAFVHGVGLPVVNNGSHFFSQDFMEDGTELSVQASDGQGWGGRTMQRVLSTEPWRGFGYSKILQRTYFGAPKTIAIPDPTNYNLNGSMDSLLLRKTVLQLLYNVAEDPLSSAAFDSLQTVEKLNPEPPLPDPFTKPSTSTYPTYSGFGNQMKRVQQLIQASHDPTFDVCIESVMLDYGDWDNHADMGPTPNTAQNPSNEGMHNRMLDVFGSMKAFYDDLTTHAPSANWTFVFMTEFGRRITANGDAGVDHGKGLLMAIMGSSGINGRNVFTMLPNGTDDGIVPGWQGLDAHKVLQPGTGTGPMNPSSWNLLNTIDYRRVLGEILEKRIGLDPSDVRDCFPGYGYGLTPETSPIGAML